MTYRDYPVIQNTIKNAILTYIIFEILKYGPGNNKKSLNYTLKS